MQKCIILKSFLYSTDGITEHHATKGSQVSFKEDVADALQKDGLVKYVAKPKAKPKSKSVDPASENKMQPVAPENK